MEKDGGNQSPGLRQVTGQGSAQLPQDIAVDSSKIKQSRESAARRLKSVQVNGPEQAQDIHRASQGEDSVRSGRCCRHEPPKRTAGRGKRKSQARAALMASRRSRADQRSAGRAERWTRLFAAAAKKSRYRFANLLEFPTQPWR
jgi:hypothetical protein